MRIKSIRAEFVGFMPKTLDPGVLYVSEMYGTAAHLCACGCGEKIRTPLTKTEWTFINTYRGPSLYPSIGNWQKQCRSHYWIQNGEIRWAEDWSEAQIEDGRKQEEKRRRDYLREKYDKDKTLLHILIDWIKSIIKR